jgi:hypothetical protein
LPCDRSSQECDVDIIRKKENKKKTTTPRAKNKRLASFIYIYSSSRASLAPYKRSPHPKTKDSECIFDGPKKKARTYYFTMDPFVLLQTTFV